jgi:tRNA G10  N-methylase Trm11
MKAIALLGRQPALGMAELESIVGADAVELIHSGVASLSVDSHEIPFDLLGGTIKLAQVLTVLPTSSWKDVHDYLVEKMPEQSDYVRDGKLTIGLSAVGLRVSPREMNATGLSIKKAIRTHGRPVRIVPNKEKELNSAQVIHNGLTGPNGWELLFVRHGDKTILAQTTHIQDIESYAARDQARPMRDAKVGMLPPKLAQIIINLATDWSSQATKKPLLDPFCGTGVLLQEAMLGGRKVIGSDLESRMVSYTRQNLAWLSTKYHLPNNLLGEVVEADATTHTWKGPIGTVACETYLGKPLTSLPDKKMLDALISEVNTIHEKFLKNIASQLKKDDRICIAVPAWKAAHGFIHLPVLDHLEHLGYNRVKFEHAPDSSLIYHRTDQIVARELVVMKRK